MEISGLASIKSTANDEADDEAKKEEKITVLPLEFDSWSSFLLAILDTRCFVDSSWMEIYE